MNETNNQSGIANPLLISTIVLAVFLMATSIFSVWAFVSYLDYKNNTQPKIDGAVAEARQIQKDEDEKAFLEREKQPVRQLVSPSDVGSVTIDYPKTWSVYVDAAAKGLYIAYLHPGAVHPISNRTPYAVKILVEPKPYEQILKTYASLIKNGSLKASPISIKGENGTRLDGTFANKFRGSVVIFKVRDKTLRVFTESDTFRPDYNGIILPSLKFTQ